MNKLTLAKVIGRRITAIAIIEFDIIWIHLRYREKAIGVVIAAGFLVLRISEPPRTTVGRLPRALLFDGAFHRVILAPAATVGTASHIHNQVGCFGIVCEVLAQSVVHDGPVVLVARRPNLPSSRTRIWFCALRHLQTVGNFLDEVASRVSRDWYTGDFTVCCTARGTFH